MLVELSQPRARLGRDSATILLFFAALLAPWIDTLVRPSEARRPVRERREAAPLPAFPVDLAAIVAAPPQWNAHFDDVFGLRDVLLHWNARLKIDVFGVSPAPKLYLGRAGWIFYAGNRSVDALCGLNPWRAGALEAFVNRHVERHRALKARGIEYVLAIVPNKETVHPEFLPAHFNKVGPTRLEALRAEFGRLHCEFWIDLTRSLCNAGPWDVPDEPLYCPTGTHWEPRGTFVVQRAILGHLSGRFPALQPALESELELVDAPRLEDSVLNSLYLEDRSVRGAREFVPREPRARVTAERARRGGGTLHTSEIAGSALPRALLIHDSFGPYLEPLLAERFSFLGCAWTNRFDDALVTRLRPDVVIEIFVERRLVRDVDDGDDARDE